MDVDYLKYNWRYHGTVNAQETYKTISDVLYATGRLAMFSLCEWGNNDPWLCGEEIDHLWRTTGDVIDYCDSRRYIVWVEKYAGSDHWNDPDMLDVGNPGLSHTESKAHFSLWCILATTLMAGNDIRNMSDEICAILIDKEVIAIDQDPPDIQGYRFMHQPGKEIWVKELSNGEWAVCFFNTSDKSKVIKVNWNHLSFLQGSYKVHDLWEKKDLGITNKEFHPGIEPHGVVLLKLSPVHKLSKYFYHYL